MEEQSIIRFPVQDSVLRNLFLSVARWAKAVAVIGLIFQLFIVVAGVSNINDYWKYLDTRPHMAMQRLVSGLYELLLACVYSIVYVLSYCFAISLQNACEKGTEQELEKAFRINIRILKINGIMIFVAIIRYGYLLWERA